MLASILFYAILFLASFFLFLLLYLRPLLPLLSSRNHIALTISPNSLKIPHVVSIIFFLFLKPNLRYIGLVPNLQRRDQSRRMILAPAPDLRITMPLRVRTKDRARYDLAVGAGYSSPDVGYIFFLIGVTTPLALLMLARRLCPILPIGAVNTRNRFEILNPLLCRAILIYTACYAVSQLKPEVRRVKRGVEVDIIVEVFCDVEGFSQSILIFRQIITILQFMKMTEEPHGIQQKTEAPALDQDTNRAVLKTSHDTLRVDANAPFLWAEVCKDYNPIHISSMVARTLGFRGKIAHGNLVAARAMEHLANQKSEFEMLNSGDKPFWLEVAFHRPVVVPMTLSVNTISTPQQDSPTRFELDCNSKTFVAGAVGWL